LCNLPWKRCVFAGSSDLHQHLHLHLYVKLSKLTRCVRKKTKREIDRIDRKIRHGHRFCSKERSNGKQFYTVTFQPSRRDQSSFRGGTQVQNPAGIAQAQAWQYFVTVQILFLFILYLPCKGSFLGNRVFFGGLQCYKKMGLGFLGWVKYLKMLKC